MMLRLINCLQNWPVTSYPEYKDSGIEWIGEIPEHWEAKRLKYLMKVVMGQSPKSAECNVEGIGMPFLQGCKEFGKHSPTADQFCSLPPKIGPKDSILMSVRAPVGELNVADRNYGIGRGLCALVAVDNVSDKQFYYFQLEAITFEMAVNSSGSTYDAIKVYAVKMLRYTAPSFREQTQISHYLNTKTSQIDLLVEKLERKIELLKEYRTKLISQCVTKGLDPNVELKYSGIEWIGEIPIHWIVNRVSRITYVKGRIGWKGLTSEEFIDEGPYLVTGTDFQNGRIDWSGTYHVNQFRFNDDPFIVLQKDDVLITKDGTIGKVAHVQDLPGPATLNSGIFVTRPLSNSYMQRYFYWILNSGVFSGYVDYSSSGTTIQHLYQNVFEQFYLPIPPLTEQSEVSSHLDIKTSQIDSLVEKLEQKIELLKENRQSLISNVVTGKIRVTEEVV